MLLREGLEGRLRVTVGWSASPQSLPRSMVEVNPSGNHFKAHEGQEEDGQYSVQIYEAEIMPYLPCSLL